MRRDPFFVTDPTATPGCERPLGWRNAVALFALSVALAPLNEGIEAGKKDEATTALAANGEQAIFQIMRESLITGGRGSFGGGEQAGVGCRAVRADHSRSSDALSKPSLMPIVCGPHTPLKMKALLYRGRRGIMSSCHRPSAWTQQQ